MKSILALAALAVVTLSGQADAINLKLTIQNKAQEKVILTDGPTNGEMSEDEKDTLIQVLCPGNIQTSYSKSSGKSSTCNSGAKSEKALVQENVESGETQIE